MAKRKLPPPPVFRDRIVGLRRVRAGDLLPDARNYRRHPQLQQDALRGMIREIGFADALLVRETPEGLRLIDGHLRAGLEPDAQVPVLVLDLDEAEAGKLLATLDPLASMAQIDHDALSALLASVQLEDEAIAAMLRGLADYQPLGLVEPSVTGEPKPPRPTLADRFIVPPFSVLDARQGYWQERKRQWLAMGIQSELGRGEAGPMAYPVTGQAAGVTRSLNNASASRSTGLLGESEQALSHYGNATPGGSPPDAASLGDDGKTVRGDGRGKGLARKFGHDLMRGEHVVGERLTWKAGSREEGDLDETSRKILAGGRRARPPHGPSVTQNTDGTLAYHPSNNGEGQSGTSVFDPVLCELVYRWFSPPDGKVLDPFAGGSVRGIVASALGRRYTGVDLSERQLDANRLQAQAIVPSSLPTWHTGDSVDIAALAPGEYDLVFSCPPYGDLERYSDDPRDISSMSHEAFLAAYRQIIAASVSMLRPDRFACFVVGDIRDRKGLYRNLVSNTIAAFQDAGMSLYNEAILVTAVGSLSIKVGRQFSSGRKLGKTHQNVLVFVKGDPRRATEACGEVEVTMPEGESVLAQ